MLFSLRALSGYGRGITERNPYNGWHNWPKLRAALLDSGILPASVKFYAIDVDLDSLTDYLHYVNFREVRVNLLSKLSCDDRFFTASGYTGTCEVIKIRADIGVENIIDGIAKVIALCSEEIPHQFNADKAKQGSIPDGWQEVFAHNPNGFVRTVSGQVIHKHNAETFRGMVVKRGDIALIPTGLTMRDKSVKWVKLKPEDKKPCCPECGAFSKEAVKCDLCNNAKDGKNKNHSYHCGCGHCRNVRIVPKGKERDLILGVELELNSIYDKPSWFTSKSTLESDASIRHTGGEIITSPMTYEEHVEFWSSKQEILKKCDAPVIAFKKRRNSWHEEKTEGYIPSDSHGLHVHVNRAFMERQKWACLITALNKGLYNIVTKIGGRGSGRYRHFMTETMDMRGGFAHSSSISTTVAMWLSSGERSHSFATSVNNNTIEFRFCKSDTDVRTIIGRIGMIESLVVWFNSREIDADGVSGEDYIKFLREPNNKKRWPQTLRLATKK